MGDHDENIRLLEMRILEDTHLKHSRSKSNSNYKTVMQSQKHYVQKMRPIWALQKRALPVCDMDFPVTILPPNDYLLVVRKIPLHVDNLQAAWR